MRNIAKGFVLIIALLLVMSATPHVAVKAQLLDTFTMNYSPTTLSVAQGDSGTVQITVTSINNFSAPVSLSFTGAPIGVSINFDNNPVTPPPGGGDSSTAFFSVDPSVPATTYQMTLVGSSGSDVKNYDFSLQVTPVIVPGDFGISVSPQVVTVQAGGSGSATVSITSINGFSGPVTLSSSGQPSGVSVNFSPTNPTPPAGGSADSSVSVSVANFVQAGSYPLTITGSGSSSYIIQHSTQLNLQVSSPQDFTITVNPSSINIQKGGSTTASVIVSAIGGFSSPVGLSASNGVPSGVQVGFSPNPITPGSSTMSINVAASAGVGTFNFQVLGTSGSLSHGTTFTMTISQAAQPSFSLSSSSGSIALSQAGPGSVKIGVSSVNGFSSPVNTYASWVGPTPTGVTVTGPGTLTPPPNGAASGTLTLTASASASVGNYLLSLVGTSGSLSTSTNIGVQILTGAGDFSISLSPTTMTMIQGSAAGSTLTIQSSGTFSSPVTLSASPASGLSVSFATNPLTPPVAGKTTTQVTITAAGIVGTGTYTVPIIGTGGSLSHTTSITVTVNEAETPDFTVVAGPNAISIVQGSTGNSVIAVLSQSGFSSTVTLSVSWTLPGPGGVSYNLPSPITPQPNTVATSTLTVTASSGASVGTYTLEVTGSSGALIHETQITVQISGSSVTTSTNTSSSSSSTTTSPPPPTCLIATATYGSTLAPNVQFLRSFRDQQVMNTFVGWNFMIAFNAWYYSFSPTVAQSITQHPTFQYSMRFALYPLIEILRFGALPFSVLTSHQEIAGVLSGLLISSLIGVAYLALPLTLLFRFAPKLRRNSKNTQRVLVVILVVALSAVTIAELATSSPLMIVGSAATALSTLLLAALYTSRKLLQLTETRILA